MYHVHQTIFNAEMGHALWSRLQPCKLVEHSKSSRHFIANSIHCFALVAGRRRNNEVSERHTQTGQVPVPGQHLYSICSEVQQLSLLCMLLLLQHHSYTKHARKCVLKCQQQQAPE